MKLQKPDLCHLTWLLLSIIFFSVSGQETFTNPIIDGNSADPFVTRIGDSYYLTLSTSGETQLTIYKSSELTNFRNVESKTIFSVPAGYANAWASEVHLMKDGLYIYFAMNMDGATHRMYAIKADDPTDPMGNWSNSTRMMPEWDIDAIDLTPFKNPNGITYAVWCEKGRLMIAEMINSLTVSNDRVLFREPKSPWEGNVNEGPFFIYRNNVSYLVFSASGTFGPDYSLGLMSIEDGKNPMVIKDWNFGEDAPVFYRNDEEDVYGPGHASFTVSPDGTETWMIYHAAVDPIHVDGYRIARAEKIEWTEDGKPIFPRPHGYFNPIPIPSGQITVTGKATFTNPIISGNSADPHAFRLGDTYYLSLSTNKETELTIYKSKQLTNFRNAESQVILGPQDCMFDIWASELHIIKEELYIYFTYRSCENAPEKDHWMYVMKADDPKNPLGNWSTPIRLIPELDAWTIDGTVLQHGDGKLYFVFDTNADRYGLWIAPMSDPVTVVPNSRVFLKGPSEPWEGGTNEGAYFLYNQGVSYMVYSARDTGDPDYCLGLMSINATADPMVPENWYFKSDGPVFYRNDDDGVFATGHAGFTTSPDGTETWMTYHGSVDTNNIWGYRIARAEKITWGSDGVPIFPRPHGYFNSQPVPSGQL